MFPVRRRIAGPAFSSPDTTASTRRSAAQHANIADCGPLPPRKAAAPFADIRPARFYATPMPIVCATEVPCISVGGAASSNRFHAVPVVPWHRPYENLVLFQNRGKLRLPPPEQHFALPSQCAANAARSSYRHRPRPPEVFIGGIRARSAGACPSARWRNRRAEFSSMTTFRRAGARAAAENPIVRECSRRR